MVQPAEHVVYAIHDYEIPGKGFLPLRAGDVIYVIDADTSGWWLGINLRRQKGVFPSTYTLPYVFPLPAADLVHDTRLIMLAREFGVDVASGAPTPLHELPTTPTPHAPTPAMPSTDFLREELQRLLLERESARKTVLRHLEELLSAQERWHALQQQQQQQQQQAEATRRSHEQQSKVQNCKVQKAMHELRSVVDTIDKQKHKLLLRGRAPSNSWYDLFADVVATVAAGAAALEQDAVSPRECFWRAALTDVKSVVGQQEEQLAALSSDCEAKEAAFTAAAAALQSRIEWRDSNVAAMLVYWADAAATAKSTYISCKTEREAAVVAHQQEAAQLRYRLEEGRERFAETKEKYRKCRREAQKITELLKQQDALQALSREIAQVGDQITSRQQQLPCGAPSRRFE